MKKNKIQLSSGHMRLEQMNGQSFLTLYVLTPYSVCSCSTPKYSILSQILSWASGTDIL